MNSTKLLKRKVSLSDVLRYRGKQGMLTWILHRITGLGILIFVGTHVIAAFFLQQFADDVAIAITAFYESWLFQLVVYFCVLYHALHGTRLALVDLFPGLLRFHLELIWLQWILFIPLYGLPAFVMVQTALTGGS
jgi:succinate dehydrogenase / fumarate reductase cytochrome b subunit